MKKILISFVISISIMPFMYGQLSVDTEPETILCVTYDPAGNLVLLIDCDYEEPEEGTTDSPGHNEESYIVQIAPNPTEGNVIIIWEEKEDSLKKAVLTPLSGQNIALKAAVTENRAEINIGGYPQGIYILQLSFTSGRTITKTLIKK